MTDTTESVRAYLAEHPGVSRAQLQRDVEGSAHEVDAAFDALVEAGEAEYRPPEKRGMAGACVLVDADESVEDEGPADDDASQDDPSGEAEGVDGPEPLEEEGAQEDVPDDPADGDAPGAEGAGEAAPDDEPGEAPTGAQAAETDEQEDVDPNAPLYRAPRRCPKCGRACPARFSKREVSVARRRRQDALVRAVECGVCGRTYWLRNRHIAKAILDTSETEA
ncbi:MAG: hypothetical protein ACOC9N_03455 [Gemmatimonadota bacterium]